MTQNNNTRLSSNELSGSNTNHHQKFSHENPFLMNSTLTYFTLFIKIGIMPKPGYGNILLSLCIITDIIFIVGIECKLISRIE